MAAPADASEFRELFPASIYPEFKDAALDDAIDTTLALAADHVRTLRPAFDVDGRPFAGAVSYLTAHFLTRDKATQSTVGSSVSGGTVVVANNELAGTAFGRSYLQLTRGRKVSPTLTSTDISLRLGVVA